MDLDVVECASEKECPCKSGATLDILKDVQRAYEGRLQLVERVGGEEKMQMQVRVLRSWVSDLVAQNALLVRAVEELERETTARAAAERRRRAEIECELRVETAVLHRRLARKDSDLRGLIEVLRRLREFDHCSLEGIHFFDVTQSDIFGSDDWLAKNMVHGRGDSGEDTPTQLDADAEANTFSLKIFMLNATNGGEERENRSFELSLINDSLQKDVLAKDREIRRLNKDLQQYEQTMARMRDEMNPDVLKKDAEVMAGMSCTGTECGDLVPVKDIGELLREETSKYRERIQNMEISLKSSSVKLRTAHKVNLGLIEELTSLRRFFVAVDMERRDLKLKLDLEGQIVKQMVRQLRQAKAKSHARVATSTPDGTQVLPDEAEISIIPPPKSAASDEYLDDESIILELCKCGAHGVHDQTTLKIDTPDRTQNLLNQTRNLITESSPRNESGNRWSASDYSPLNQNRTVQTECSSRNQRGTITSQSIRNQDTNLVTECSPRDLSDNQTLVSSQIPFCLPRYVIPIARSREPSENLHLGSSQSARNQSTNIDYEYNSRDQIASRKPASDQSQSGYNIPEEIYGEQSNSQQNRYNITEERLRKQRESLQPDLTQNTRNQSFGLVSEQSLRDQSVKQKSGSNQSLTKMNNREANLRERNVSLQLESSQNSRNQSTNYQKDNEKPAYRSQSKHNIPEMIPTERSVSLQPDSDQSDNNQSTSISEHSYKEQIDDQKTAPNERYSSRYPMYKAGPRDLVIKLEKDQSRNSKYKTLVSLSEHTTVGTHSGNPPEQSESLLKPSQEPDQSQTISKEQSKNDEEITKLSEINDGMGSEECLCKCLCEKSSHDSQEHMSSEHLEATSKSENNTEKSKKQCQCKCLCQYSSYDPITKSDTQKCTSSEHLLKVMSSKSENNKERTGNKSENDKEKRPDECQCDPITISDTQKRKNSEHLAKETSIRSANNKEKTGNKSENDQEQRTDECQWDPMTISDTQTRKISEHLAKETSIKSANNKEKTGNKSENDQEKRADECQCDPMTISDTQTRKSSEHLAKETSIKSANDKEKSEEQCQCKCLCQYSSYDPITISDTQTCMSSEHLPKQTSFKSANNKEKTCNKSENGQEKSAEECQCKCTCGETEENDNSTISVNQRWMITPEGIMKGLEALKRSFLGQSEDHTTIWINSIANRNQNYPNENIQETELSSSLPKPRSATSHHKKTVTIQEPIRSDKCVYCDPSGSCEELSDGCASPNRETQKPENGDGSQGAESVFIVETAGLKTRPGTHRESTEDEDGTSETTTGPRRMLRTKPVTKEAVQDSGGGSSCVGAREQYYRDKLLATLQILENKEETIRVQGSSLAVAEDRIAELTKRAGDLRQELEHKARELNQTRQFADRRVDKSDVSISAEAMDAEAQKHLVDTLEDNLSTVIELYRECFYETAKQEELIDMLRKSYLDVRLMEKDKTERINRLQNVINTQKRSIEQCQDVVLEVESLKSEISSFLNSSNNDSGMWERGSESPDVGEELADILDQLRQLQQMLTSDCTCGLEEECTSLKERNKALEVQLENQKQRNNELDGALRKILDQQYEEQLKDKEREFQELVQKLADVENTYKKRSETCEALTRQLQQAEVMLGDKTAELVEAQQAREAQESTIRRLQQDLDKSDRLVQEGLKKLSEVAHSRTELLLESQARISELEQRLRNATRRGRDLEASCREREACLEEAQTRGARLCEESRRITAGLKMWMREKKQLFREQQEKIKIQKLRIRELERCVGAGQNFCELTSQSETDPGCSNSTQEYRLPCDTSYTRCPRLNPACRSETTTVPRGPVAESIERELENETASCSKCASNRQSASEMASCSQAPVPPRQKKRQSSDDINYRQTSQPPRDRFEPSGHPDIRWSRLYSRLRQASPTDEVLERVEHLHAALASGQRRWGRQRR